MACDVIDIPSPTGGELAMAEYMQQTLRELGMNGTWQEAGEGGAYRERAGPGGGGGEDRG